ncbi:chorion class high-cysteine HCB protein 13-like [Diaphorina citri]|uniref:Chorion class high-cysteine HCB protein 13-like n=1 Tax=Diaphorina citri TaxID=121845 RepID=A0A1S3CYF9_DIACI|nr:chorion class high-cysteine HCB protein 13-like [Diaphorina citri]KAI5719127.1 hypothetical protein M8J76_005548 [Diaphorina citri]KAI5720695.1 hypothetical protein M8J77_010432 [Diaphorina citri]
MAMLLNNDILVLEALKYLSGPSGAPVGEHQVLGLVNFKAAVTLSAGDIRQSLASLHKLGMIDVFVPLTQACCGDACGGCCGGGCCNGGCCGCGRYYRVKIGSLV